jgi:hypothetical protein
MRRSITTLSARNMPRIPFYNCADGLDWQGLGWTFISQHGGSWHFQLGNTSWGL